MIKNKILKFFEHPLIKGSSIILVGSILGNLLNFLFNLFMSRNLSVSDYGILASLVSLISLFGVPAGSIVPTIINFAAIYFAKGQLDNVRSLYFKVSKLFLGIGLISLVVFIVFTRQIGGFFNIYNNFLIILAGLIVFLGFITVGNAPLLQAKLLFKFIVFANSVGSILKLSIGVFLVFLGFGVGGAMWAYFLSSLAPYILSFIPLGFLFHGSKKGPDVNVKGLFSYGAPSSLALFGLSSFISTDILLVKHFFDPNSAGMYAALSLVGRVIFFFSAPIGTVMFPLAVHRHAREEKYTGLLMLSLALVFLLSAGITIGYFIFPELVIKLFLKKDEYLFIVPLLGIFGIFITMFSLLSVITNFYLSIKKTGIFIPIIIGAAAQAVLIWFFHKSLLEVILISLITVSLLLFSLLLYYWNIHSRHGKKQKLSV